MAQHKTEVIGVGSTLLIQEPRQCPPRGRQTPETEGAPMTMLFLTICWVVIFTTLHLRIRILVRRVDELERKIR